MASTSAGPDSGNTHLTRSVGFWGLMFVSLGSIIGSGWLLGALNAANVAGPSSVLSWILAAALLTVLALIHAELGAAYPVAGGTGRFPFFAFGSLGGFIGGWSSWLQAVAIAPIEIEASISYISSVKWFQKHFVMIHSNGTLNGTGLIVATIAMVGFTLMNLAGAAFMAESNVIVVIWKAAVPVLAIVVIASLAFHGGNFGIHVPAHTYTDPDSHKVTHYAAASGFMPFGLHGVFAALPAGVVFALQGFEQCVQLAGEARNPKKDISRAIIMAMSIGAVLYLLLQLVFIGALSKSGLISGGWDHPIGAGDYGPYYTLALSLGAGWLATMLIIDAVISPAGTGIVYVGTTSRLTYGLGGHEEMPRFLRRTNAKGTPVWAILIAAGVGELCFAPFPSWKQLVGVVTGATAIMYAFAPVSLAALHRNDPDRPRPYKMPMPALFNPVGFCAANLIIYWGGFEYTWKLDVAVLIGLVIFGIGVAVRQTNDKVNLRNAVWIPPWFIGLTLINLAGRYGKGAKNWLPDFVDLLVVVGFSLVIFYWAVSCCMDQKSVEKAVEFEQSEIEAEAEVFSG
jgi:amino acid transporter